MDWWNVLKGRGKIRIPAKRKQLKVNPNRSKATGGRWWDLTERDRKRDAYVERQNRMADREDAIAQMHAFRQPQVMDHVMQDSKASSTNTLPVDMGPPSKFRRRGNLKRESDRSEDPLRRKFVAHDRPGFRTGGGETLPLPDSEKERDLRDLHGTWGDEGWNEDGLYHQQLRLSGAIRSRADKVNRPEKDPTYFPNEEELRALNERIRFLQTQQYDRAGNRIQQGEQNE